MASGEVWIADGGDSVAMWDPPGGLYIPPGKQTWADMRKDFTAVERERWATYDDALAVPGSCGV